MGGFGYGYGFGPAARLLAGAAAPPPAQAPGYFNTAVASPVLAYGAQRVIAGSSAPLFKLRRADATELDVSCVSGGDYPDLAALVTWAGGTATTVTTWYDQTGNGHHLAQATAAKQPSFDPARVLGNASPILFDGQRTTIAGPVDKWLQVGSLSVNRRSMTILDVVEPTGSLADGVLWLMTDTTVAQAYANEYATGSTTETTPGLFTWLGTGFAAIGGGVASAPRAQPDVIVSTLRAAGRELRIRGQLLTDANAGSSQVATDLVLGRNPGNIATSGVYSYNARCRRYGFAIYPELDATNTAIVQADGQTAFAHNSTFPYRVVVVGDSNTEGVGVLLAQSNVSMLRDQCIHNGEFFNFGLSGKTLAGAYTNRVGRLAPMYSASVPTVFIIPGGINDIRVPTTAVNVYNNSTAPLVGYLHGLGANAIVCSCTLPPSKDAQVNQTEWAAYNALVVGNAGNGTPANIADVVIDLAAHPIMGAAGAPDDTSLFQTDKLHPKTYGHQLLSPLFYGGLQSALRLTALGGSYVP